MSRRVVITGGNSGIGGAMAKILCRKGFNVTIVCRSSDKAGRFLESMRQEGIRNIDWIHGDLSLLSSARETAARICAELPDVECFVHNAAMWPTEKGLNREGMEEAFVTNHLSPFLLNMALEDLFRKNGTRVVQVSAGLYFKGQKDARGSVRGDNFGLFRTYPTTKLLNLVASMGFAQRWKSKGVTINAVHPGVVRTGLGDFQGIVGLFLRVAKRLWLSPEDGAAAPVFLATDASFQGRTGLYYDRFKQKKLHPVASDPVFNQEVWDQATELTRAT